jgi:K+-sensing histidine kinase KdpD
MSILIYYDGTEYMKKTLATVKRHAKILKAKVDVVSSISRGGDSKPEKIRKMKGDLMDLKATLEKEHIPCETYILMKGNYAGDDVVRFAEEHGADEIIISAEKKTRVEKLILGSVAQYVILNADCPVVIV